MPLAKDIPACPNPPVPRPSRQATRNYTVELLTPMFGGGAAASEPDISMPFRPTSIRGHLQFWWRATIGAQFETTTELAQRHEEIWGSTDRASRVIVEVSPEGIEPRRCATYLFRPDAYPKLSWDSSLRRGADDLTYVLFPFQGKATRETVEREPSNFVASGSFHLRFRYPESLEDDVTTSVRSWLNFGGLGARTRRGCGALFCKELAPKDGEHLIEMLSTLSKYGNVSPRPWPTAAAATLIGTKNDNALASWQDTVKALRDFRQAPGLGRNDGQGRRPGRSRFPEPEAIRKVTRRSHNHQRLGYIPDNAFPRGEFGLPINFHFKDVNVGDPPDTQLYPILPWSEKIKSDRMASPLILRALKCVNGEIYPVIIRLRTHQITRVVLVGAAGRELDTHGTVRSPELAAYRDSPLRWAPKTGSALDAFIGFVKAQRQFQEVGA